MSDLRFPADTPHNITPAGDDRVLLSDTSDNNKIKDVSVDDILDLQDSKLDEKADKDDTYTKTEVDGFLNGEFEADGHAHTEAEITNLDKYTQAEVDAALGGKAPLSHTHTESDVTDLDKYTQAEVDALIAGVSTGAVHTHTSSEITDLDAVLGNKSDTEHTHSEYIPKEVEILATDIDLDTVYSGGFYQVANALNKPTGSGSLGRLKVHRRVNNDSYVIQEYINMNGEAVRRWRKRNNNIRLDWQMIGDDSGVVHTTGDETIAGEKTLEDALKIIFDSTGEKLKMGNGLGETSISAHGVAGVQFLIMNLFTETATDNASLRLFRGTNTSGRTSLDIFKGDNTTTTNSSIAGNGDSRLNRDNGNVGVGTASPTEKLDILGTTITDTLKVRKCQLLPGSGATDLDTLIDGGFYNVSGALNKPTGSPSWGYVDVYKYSGTDTFRRQERTDLNPTGDARKRFRTMQSDVRDPRIEINTGSGGGGASSNSYYIRNSGRRYLYTDNRRVIDGGVSFGPNFYNFTDASGTGAEPVIAWGDQGFLMKAGETIDSISIVGRTNHLEPTNLNIRVILSAPDTPARWDTGIDNNAETTETVIFSGLYKDGAMTGEMNDLMKREIAINHTVAEDATLILAIQPVGTLSATRYFHTNYTYKIS